MCVGGQFDEGGVFVAEPVIVGFPEEGIIFELQVLFLKFGRTSFGKKGKSFENLDGLVTFVAA